MRASPLSSLDQLARRFRWALPLLPVRPDQRILEIGSGHGIALERIAATLSTGRIVGIDRSERMRARAQQRLAAAALLDRAEVHVGALAEVDLGDEGFDLAFAINVSVFARRAARELAWLARQLRPAGAVYLFYESPAPAHVEAFRDGASANLAEHGFQVRCIDDAGPGTCVVGSMQR